MKKEIWNGHEIRFVWHENEWWAVANDVSEALEYRTTGDMTRIVDKEQLCQTNPQTIENTGLRTLCAGNENVKRMTLITELGIYDAIFSSRKPEAKEFKNWVYNMLKELRQATGLEGFQIFRMLDKEHQKEAMSKLKNSLDNPAKVDYIKANTIANKAVSRKYGYPKMLKKEDMTPDMLVARQPILDDTIDLMSAANRFKLFVSVSKAIYDKHT